MARSPTISPISPGLPPRRRCRRSRRSARSPATWTSGRSTRPSRRSRSTPCGCSRSTRTRSTSTVARSRSATPSVPPAPASSARSCTSCVAAAAAWVAPRSAQGAARAMPSSSRSTARSREPETDGLPSGNGGGNGAAFFDPDKTLMAGSSGMVFARVANQRGFVSRRQLAKWGWDHLRYRLRGSSDAQTDAVIQVARKVFATISERDVERMAPAVLAGILPRIYPQMLDEVHRHQDEGRATFIVSAAGNDLVKALAAVLGMEGGIGTSWAIGTDGKYTGEMDGPFVYGEGKVEAMKRFAERHEIDMGASYAYSDSASDLPMLRSVGNAVVVNPDADLLEIARREGWRVMRFEKLGRKLAIVGATVLAAAGGLGAMASRRRHGGRLGGVSGSFRR